MTTVKQILDTKGHDVWSISPAASVFDAVKLMAEKDIGVLAVMEGEKMVGILSERDCARKVILKGLDGKDTQVKNIMTSSVIYVDPERTVEECLALMADKHFRHLPVFVDSKLDGMVSAVDLTRALLSNQEFIIAQLEQYISS